MPHLKENHIRFFQLRNTSLKCIRPLLIIIELHSMECFLGFGVHFLVSKTPCPHYPHAHMRIRTHPFITALGDGVWRLDAAVLLDTSTSQTALPSSQGSGSHLKYPLTAWPCLHRKLRRKSLIKNERAQGLSRQSDG